MIVIHMIMYPIMGGRSGNFYDAIFLTSLFLLQESPAVSFHMKLYKLFLFIFECVDHGVNILL